MAYLGQALDEYLILLPGHQHLYSVCLNVAYMQTVLIIAKDVAQSPPQDGCFLMLHVLDADLEEVVRVILRGSAARDRFLVLRPGRFILLLRSESLNVGLAKLILIDIYCFTA